MSKYASLLFSPENYHEIGPFRFPIYKDLVPGEAKRIEELSRKQSSSTFKSIKLAQKIAKDRSITTKAAIELLSNAGDKEDEEIMYDYANELEELNNSGIGAVTQQIEYVTLFMKFRAEVKLPGESEWTKTTDWTQEDTEEMPQKYVKEIFELINWEREGWPEKEGKSPDQPPSSNQRKS